MSFTWTPKRKSALEHLIRSRGNVRIAAEGSQASDVPVSEDYINNLKYRPEYRSFRDEYRRRTKKLLDAMEVDTQYVIDGLVALSEPGVKEHVRLQSLRALGDFRGIWAPTKTELKTESHIDIKLSWDDDDTEHNPAETP